jgi:hypothetical protein
MRIVSIESQIVARFGDAFLSHVDFEPLQP